MFQHIFTNGTEQLYSLQRKYSQDMRPMTGLDYTVKIIEGLARKELQSIKA
jgi:hypothetical protein